MITNFFQQKFAEVDTPGTADHAEVYNRDPDNTGESANCQPLQNLACIQQLRVSDLSHFAFIPFKRLASCYLLVLLG